MAISTNVGNLIGGVGLFNSPINSGIAFIWIIITCIQKVKSVLGIDRFFSSPLFCQEQAGHFGLVGIGIEQEDDGHEGKEGQNNYNSWLWWLLKLFPLSFWLIILLNIKLNLFKIFFRKVWTNTHASKLKKPLYSNLKPFSGNHEKDCSLANDKCNILDVLCRLDIGFSMQKLILTTLLLFWRYSSWKICEYFASKRLDPISAKWERPWFEDLVKR